MRLPALKIERGYALFRTVGTNYERIKEPPGSVLPTISVAKIIATVSRSFEPIRCMVGIGRLSRRAVSGHGLQSIERGSGVQLLAVLAECPSQHGRVRHGEA